MSEDVLGVVIVDDDFRVADIHGALVQRVPGYQVVGKAHTAEQAVDQVRTLRPDLVLMDVYLPDRNGLDVLRTLLDEPDPPAVIVITAAREIASVRAAMQLGAVHYLVKPFDFSLLIERLTAYRQLRHRLAGLPGEPAQSEVDELFGMLRATPSPMPRPAKGHSAPTLELVRNVVRSTTGDVSAAEVAGEVGISRATAQRYLNYLEQQGLVQLRLKYGAAGRPEHRYHPRA
ncbi:response regulator [Allobranchiibius sp. GilTou73]|uniref:response regulator n=1 Tax=Allobranchiibius sp. GilTou73 TaxID=2904523 RepID=UPI001F1B86E7|nr:response regulator [Allobranchiibius sp. GilTou73]UIJ36017.1 response regulator [Allobranchiibius sp. GilTou73]